MEFKVIEETPKMLVAEIPGAGHTLCNTLKVELWNNSKVKLASYSINHPLVGVPRFVIETDGSVKPKKALADAAAKLQKEAAILKTEFKKIK